MSLKEVLKQLGIKLIGWVKSNCVNNLLSDRADLPLAAAQGKVIDEKITALNSNITNFTVKEKLGSCLDGTISFDATKYKYVYVTSVGGSTLIPVPLLRLLGDVHLSHSRYAGSGYNAYLYMTIAINKLTISNYITAGWSKTEIVVYGIR